MSEAHSRAIGITSTLNTVISRRGLLKRAAVVGAAAPVIGTLIAACEADDVDDTAVDEPANGSDDEAVPGDEPDEDDAAVDDEPVDEPDDDPDDEVDDVADDAEDDDRYGGTLNVAIEADPPTIDVMPTTAQVVGFFGWHIWEGLFTWNDEMEPVPQLIESHEVTDDGLTNTLVLREDVVFHNGDSMTAEDVIASVERWFEVSPRPAGLMNALEDIEQVDDYTIEFHMTSPYGAFEGIFARMTGGCTISPASVIEGLGDGDLEEFVGTGPYQFVEYAPDQHIHLERFDDYASRDEDPSGYAGRKYQYLDEIFFIPVPDAASRVAGLQAGDYHYLETVTADQFETLEGDDGVITEILEPINLTIFVFNTQEGPLAEVEMRRALQATFDHEEIAIAGVGDLFQLDPSIQIQGTAWHTTVGEDLYNQADPELGWEIAEEAGYDGELIRFMASQERPEDYNMVTVAVQQLQDAGFNAEIVTYDWATLLERREDPGEWDIFVTGSGLTTDPLLISFVTSNSWPGWWDSERKIELVNELELETDFDARYEIWEELMRVFYEDDIPMVKVVDRENLHARSAQLQGFEPITQVGGGVGFWNMWLEED
jgi:peptide/nickel transport system substrate-binding protein